MSSGRIRKAVEDQINGDRDKFDTDAEKATLRVLRVLADNLDAIESRINRITQSMLAITIAICVPIVAGAITAAIRLT